MVVAFKITEWVEQWICIKFCVELEHSSVDVQTTQMIQKATAMGNWWLAASLGQHASSCIISHAAFFWWNIKSPRWLSPLQPRFGILRLLAFSKIKITCERKEISDHQWDSGKHSGATDDWENCVRSQSTYFERDWDIIVLCTMFLNLVSSSINICIFYIMWLGTFWTDLVYEKVFDKIENRFMIKS